MSVASLQWAVQPLRISGQIRSLIIRKYPKLMTKTMTTTAEKQWLFSRLRQLNWRSHLVSFNNLALLGWTDFILRNTTSRSISNKDALFASRQFHLVNYPFANSWRRTQDIFSAHDKRWCTQGPKVRQPKPCCIQNATSQKRACSWDQIMFGKEWDQNTFAKEWNCVAFFLTAWLTDIFTILSHESVLIY